MEARIGTRILSTLKPKAKPYQVHDEDVRGLLLRIQPSGVMTYYYEYRLSNGRRNRLRIGRHGRITSHQARDRAKEIAAEIVRGNDPKATKRAAEMLTVGKFVDRIYEPWATTHLKEGASYAKRIRSRFPMLLSRPLNDPKIHWLLEQWKKERLKDGVTKTTINRDLITLKGAFSLAVRNNAETGLSSSPAGQVKLLKVATDECQRVRWLTPEEETRLFAALQRKERAICEGREKGNAWRRERGYELYPSLIHASFVNSLRPMVELTLHTGLRRGELFRVRWQDVNWNAKSPTLTILGSISKNGKTRHISLNERALTVLHFWRQSNTQESDLIFPGKGGKPLTTLKTAWGAVIEEAEIKDFRWHDLRHTFASRLAMAGVDLNSIRELLGHADLKMTLRYAHLSPKTLADAVSKLISSPNLRSNQLLPHPKATPEHEGSLTPPTGNNTLKLWKNG